MMTQHLPDLEWQIREVKQAKANLTVARKKARNWLFVVSAQFLTILACLVTLITIQPASMAVWGTAFFTLFVAGFFLEATYTQVSKALNAYEHFRDRAEFVFLPHDRPL